MNSNELYVNYIFLFTPSRKNPFLKAEPEVPGWRESVKRYFTLCLALLSFEDAFKYCAPVKVQSNQQNAVLTFSNWKAKKTGEFVL